MSGYTHIYAPVPTGAEGFALAGLVQANKPLLYIAADDKAMQRTHEVLRFMLPQAEIITFPAWDCLPYDRISPNSAVMSRRLSALSRLVARSKQPAQRPLLVLTTVNAALQKVPPREVIVHAALSLRQGDEVNRRDLVQYLVHNGYAHVSKVAEAGDYAVRGSIIDIFPPGHSDAYRLDFFGDTLESLRMFDALTQVSSGTIGQLELIPASEILLREESINRFRGEYRGLAGGAVKDDALYHAISEGRKYAGMEHWLPLFYAKLETLFDYVPDALVIECHGAPEQREARQELIADYYEARKDSKHSAFGSEQRYFPVKPESLYGAGTEAQVLLSPFANEQSVSLSLTPAVNIYAEAKREGHSPFDGLKALLSEQKHTVLLACMSEGSRARLLVMCDSHEIKTQVIDDMAKASLVPHGVLGLAVMPMEHGLTMPAFTIFSEQDILGERIVPAHKKRTNSEVFMAEAASLQEGELVVHYMHGIGRFEGLETLDVQGIKHDCLKLVYYGDDRLYLPVENIGAITRYGSEEAGVQLDKLGSGAWQKRTANLRKRIKVTAQELIAIAAKRQIKPADRFIPGQEYTEFCERFPYTETEDQLRSIQEVERDLSSGHPMDRLICGDVGFGKTEVALRAAFIVAYGDGKAHGQVAIITPTTLLARQHFQEFQKRFAGFPLRVGMLSRFTTAAEAKKVQQGLAEGSVDIVIGTHALLAKNVAFKKLSLVIIDEEQHFGVKQKERLKNLRAQTHVLAMTATPIPRTLQLSLTGVRDLSLITTPPVDRLAVRTYVMPQDDMVIREAILRERFRGGRTFYVCPRISDLDTVEKELKTLVPEASYVRAHGQLPAQELDGIMNAFYDGKYDVLLSTTIIESGIDIPSANTLIVHRADMFGLAQLYQIRGRVGRSNVRAYAYLTLPPRHKPTKQALRRLEVMQQLDTLGAGFTLASHDMDIRGFGNLLGEEQSGNIREVGLELYQEMLKEAVEALQSGEGGSETEEKLADPQINIGVSVLIPEQYMPDLSLRLGLYKRIGHVQNDAEIEAVAAEMIDRFGPLPEEVQHLFEVMRIKALCRHTPVSRLDIGPKGVVIQIDGARLKQPEKLLEFIHKHRDALKLRPDQSIFMALAPNSALPERISNIRYTLSGFAALMA